MPGCGSTALVEHPFLDWKVDFLVEDEATASGACRRAPAGELPLMFSLLATKPG